MNFGDSLLNCLNGCLPVAGRALKQLSKLSPKFLLVALVTHTAAFAAAPKVVASFKPVHSLVASIMEGIGEPYLLVKGSASPHTYSMTPSDAAALQDAAAIFWIGHGLETFLDKPLQALAGTARVVTLEDLSNLTLHYVREGGSFEQHAHEDEQSEAEKAAERKHGHAHGAFDPHIWLDPENAKAMAREIAKSLSDIDPANAVAYQANTNRLVAELDVLSKELEIVLKPARGKPFITFHDAFQYFEKRFEVEAAGSVTVNPDVAPGAERVAALQVKVKELGAICLFTEPNFDPKIMSVVTEGTTAKIASLDPEASSILEGPGLYAQSLREISRDLAACLGT
jgi:zinc transport system substrate-binding protein